MSHDTTHTNENQASTSFKSSIWFMLVLAGLFIGAVNFVTVMSHDEGGHGEDHGTEHAAPAAGHSDHGHGGEHEAPEGGEHHAH